MQTTPVTPTQLGSSIIAVPPLARNADLTVNRAENKKLVQHIEAGGVTTLLYGGNANFYHVPFSNYENLLTDIVSVAGENTLVIPAAGPSYGMMMDQASVLKQLGFPTAMLLPQREIATSQGICTAVRHFVKAFDRPVVLYIKHDGLLDVADVKSLFDEGLLAAIKYAIVRENTSDDDYLKSLVDAVDPAIIVSGIGEQPAIEHLRDFGLNGFTSGCVCVNPALSMQMLRALKSSDYDLAERIRQVFVPLEDLRNGIHPIRVLHRAVSLCGIAETGPILPLLNDVTEDEAARIGIASTQLLQHGAVT